MKWKWWIELNLFWIVGALWCWGRGLLFRIVTGNKTWAHHYELTKRQSVEWHHPQSPRKKKFKTTPSARKVMITVFWDTDGVILVDVMARGETVNLNACIKTLQNWNSVTGECSLTGIQDTCWFSMIMPTLKQVTNPGGNRQIWFDCAPPSPL